MKLLLACTLAVSEAVVCDKVHVTEQANFAESSLAHICRSTVSRASGVAAMLAVAGEGRFYRSLCKCNEARSPKAGPKKKYSLGILQAWQSWPGGGCAIVLRKTC